MIWTTTTDKTSLADVSPGHRGGGASNAPQAGHTRNTAIETMKKQSLKPLKLICRDWGTRIALRILKKHRFTYVRHTCPPGARSLVASSPQKQASQDDDKHRPAAFGRPAAGPYRCHHQQRGPHVSFLGRPFGRCARYGRLLLSAAP